MHLHYVIDFKTVLK